MSWREFLRVYVPSLIAAVFVVAFLPDSGGWAQVSGGHTGFQDLAAIVGYLWGIALPLLISSFGVGAVVWVVVYPFNSDRPSYLRFVKNTLFVFAAFLIVGSLYGVAQEAENSSGPEEETISDKENTTSGADRKEETLVRDEDGDPIRLEVPEQENTAETWNETALWKLSVEQEVVKWISKGETVTVIEGGGSHYKVEHEGEVGYVRKENLKPEDM